MRSTNECLDWFVRVKIAATNQFKSIELLVWLGDALEQLRCLTSRQIVPIERKAFKMRLSSQKDKQLIKRLLALAPFAIPIQIQVS